MSRTIKFRGKRKNGDEWIVGDLNHINGLIYIFPRTDDTPLNSPDWFEVNHESVGQWTGLIDKNRKEIYEGDLAKTALGHFVEIRWDFCSEKTEDWDFEYTGFCMHNRKLNKNFHLDKGERLEIIGNIYQDKP